MAPKKPPVSKGVNQEAARAMRAPKKAPQAPPASPPATPAPSPARAAPRTGRLAAPQKPSRRQPTTAATSAPPVAPAGDPNAAAIDAEARKKYADAAWVFDYPDLAQVVRDSVKHKWMPEEIKGALFKTEWFRTRGTHKVATALKQKNSAYLVPMDDGTLRNWAAKLITGEVQQTEYEEYIKNQSASMFAHNPELVGAIQRGMSVVDYAAPYRAKTAQVLELPPEAVDLNQSKWRRMLDGVVDEKGARRPVTISEWEETLKTDDSYGWRFTKNANDKKFELMAYFDRKFGFAG